jgi:hypothetical protein
MIKVAQRGRKAVFKNENRASHTVIEVDGCVVKNALCSDYVVRRSDIGDLIVELKGKDVDHAVKQVEATAQLWRQNGYAKAGMAALVVATQYPKANTAVRRAQQLFAKTYRGPLHVVTKNFEGTLDAVFSFQGPRTI